MKFCQDNWEDIKKYFDKSYMKFPLIGDEVVYVEQVGATGMRGKQSNPEFDEWVFTFANNPQGTEVEFVLPHKSFFEYEDRVFFLSRLPSKQYKRGICRDNTQVMVLTVDGFDTVELSLALINAYTAKPSFQGFRVDRVGQAYAVSPRMAVDQVGRIFIDRTRVGYIDVQARSISCSHELFLPEFDRVLKMNNQAGVTIAAPKERVRPARKQVQKEVA